MSQLRSTSYPFSCWWFQRFLEFSPRTLGKIPILTQIFQRGWNHQSDFDLQRILNEGRVDPSDLVVSISIDDSPFWRAFSERQLCFVCSPTFLEHTRLKKLSNDLSAPGFWLGVYIWQNGMTSGSLLFWGNTTINDLEVQSSEFPVSLNRWYRWYIIPQLAVYTTYIPYHSPCRAWVIIYHLSHPTTHLLREQIETAVDTKIPGSQTSHGVQLDPFGGLDFCFANNFERQDFLAIPIFGTFFVDKYLYIYISWVVVSNSFYFQPYLGK